MDEIFDGSIASLAKALHDRRISPAELTSAYLARAKRLNGRLNAFVRIDEEGAIEAAKRLESAANRNDERPPLWGIPVTVKSCIDVAGWNCPAGSLLLRDYV